MGGQDKIRPLWRHYFTGTQGLIFVVDCADHDRINEARQEFHKIVNDREMVDAIILVFANKQVRQHDKGIWSLCKSVNFVILGSSQRRKASRSPRTTRPNEAAKSNLVRPAMLCCIRGWTTGRSDMADLKL